MPSDSAIAAVGRWGALHHPAYLKFWIARTLAAMAALIVSVSVSWQVYDVTRSTFALGLVGLTQFSPALLLVLVTGTVADRYNRRLIMSLCQAAEAVCAAALLALTIAGAATATSILVIIAGIGIARAFFSPATQSLVTNLVPPKDLGSAIGWNSTATQAAAISGPALGGLLYGFGPTIAYATALGFLCAASLLILTIPKPEQKSLREPPSWSSIVGGFRYVWSEKIVLGAISLDLFAVILGGVVALLPAFARDILDTGPLGLGLLRAAPAIGALSVAFWLAVRPLRRRAGLVMFIAVTIFGIANIVFGFSRSVWLSVAMLAIAGATDQISVFVRQTLVQIWTPDNLRGRVTAVNSIFIGASNELGAFRAGTVAALIGVVPAVLLGGIGTVAVSLIWYRLFPALRNASRLDARE